VPDVVADVVPDVAAEVVAEVVGDVVVADVVADVVDGDVAAVEDRVVVPAVAEQPVQASCPVQVIVQLFCSSTISSSTG